jgi:ABC-type branched-subunit amino acid transport system ATPase component
VHQDLGLSRTLSVVENLAIGGVETSHGAINWRRERRRVEGVLASYNLDVDPSLTVDRLPPVAQALVAIVRAAEELKRYREREDLQHSVLFLDEPTVFLPDTEVEFLFELVRSIARGGTSTVFISHDLAAVRRLCQRAVVLRNGEVAGQAPLSAISDNDLVEMIVGPAKQALVGRSQRRALDDDASRRPIRCEVSALRGGRVADVTFAVRGTEVIGIAGLLGSGADDLPYLLFRAHRGESGTIAIVPSLTVAENASVLVSDRYTTTGRRIQGRRRGGPGRDLPARAPGRRRRDGRRLGVQRLRRARPGVRPGPDHGRREAPVGADRRRRLRGGDQHRRLPLLDRRRSDGRMTSTRAAATPENPTERAAPAPGRMEPARLAVLAERAALPVSWIVLIVVYSITASSTFPTWIWVAAAIAAGLLNGFLVVRCDTNPLIITLGMGSVFTGIIFHRDHRGVADDRRCESVVVECHLHRQVARHPDRVLLRARTDADHLVRDLVHTARPEVTVRGAIARDVARLSGIHVDRIRWGGFVLGGLIAGIAGVLFLGTTGSADPTASGPYLLPAYAAVFLGATSIKPGRFNAIGTAVSVYFLATGVNGLQLLGAQNYVQQLFYGAALVVAVVLSRQLRRSRA